MHFYLALRAPRGAALYNWTMLRRSCAGVAQEFLFCGGDAKHKQPAVFFLCQPVYFFFCTAKKCDLLAFLHSANTTDVTAVKTAP